MSICPSCGGEVRLYIADGRAEGSCPNCGRFCGGSFSGEEPEPEPEYVQKGWRVHCYDAGDEEHRSYKWDRTFETRDEAQVYAEKMRKEHVDQVDLIPRMVVAQ